MKSFVQFVSCKSSKSVETLPNNRNKNGSDLVEKTNNPKQTSNNNKPQESLNHSRTCESVTNLKQQTKPQTLPLNFNNFNISTFNIKIPQIMPQNFEDKIVLVTGSSGGIGAATVKYFAQAGARVIVNGRNQNSIAATAAECDELSPKSKFFFNFFYHFD